MVAQAQVVVNEIAWMGTEESYTNEWIELHNTSNAAVDLTDWALATSDDSPSVALSGSIQAGGYYMLERTDDASVPGVSADITYSGSLSNSGETIILTDASGAVVDEVVGGTEWERIGGDNESKATAQRTGNGEWVTAAATPKAANASAQEQSSQTTQSENSIDTQETESAVQDTDAQTGNDTASDTDTHDQAEEGEPYVEIDSKPVGLVNVPISFTATAYDADGDVEDAAQFHWSFGDGAYRDTRNAEHTYAYAGTYAVSMTATIDGEQYTKEQALSVREPHIAITEADNEHVVLENKGERAVPLAGWTLASGDEQFTIPDGTKLLAGATVAFSREVTDLSAVHGVVLQYPDGSKVVSFSGDKPQSTSDGTNSQNTAQAQTTQSQTDTHVREKQHEETQTDEPRVSRQEHADQSSNVKGASGNTEQAAAAAAARATGYPTTTDGDGTPVAVWLLALVGVLGIGAVSAIVIQHSKHTAADEAAHYTITEDTED